MPRAPRVHHPDAIYHVISRGVLKQDIYRSDEDRHVFMSVLARTIREHGLSIFAYCLMGNHFHILLAVADTPLGIAMHKLLTSYSLYFNRTHERVGHVFESRYKAIPCEDLKYLIRLVAYIHLNPVRAGIVSDPSEWRWSSHAALFDDNSSLLSLSRLSDISGLSIDALRELYLELIDDKRTPTRRGLDDLLALAATACGVESSALSAGMRTRAHTRAKTMFATWGREEGYSDTDIARALNCSKAAVSLLKKRNVNSVPGP